jgi:hypothetical protein
MRKAACITFASLLVHCTASDPQTATTGSRSQAIEHIEPYKEIEIVDSSVMLDARSSNLTDGHWSFRWLMEQLAPLDMEPGDFVQRWLDGFHVKEINGFPADDRVGFYEVAARWPRTPTGSLDLGQSHFQLTAIANRIDLTTAPNGEGRLAFKLINPETGLGRLLTIIFEFKLPALDTANDRAEWARRWHELGSLPFGEEYNAALQTLTDAFAARGADPKGANGSSINQFRASDGELGAEGQPWEFREFHLIEDESGTSFHPSTTRQTPDESLNGSQALAQVIVDHREEVLRGEDVIPQEMLTGASQANFQIWEFTDPSVDEPLRHAFARETCNGCHNGETQSSFFFYHVNPIRQTVPGGDGRNRLSNFVNIEDMPRRVANMQSLLVNGIASPNQQTH